MSEVPFVVKESGTVPVISHVPAFVWRCDICGWLGTGLTSEGAAKVEAARHTWEDHGVAGCAPGERGQPHAWRHVPGSDSLGKCERCGWVIGK